MTYDLDRLETIAKAATQGAWSADGPANPAPDDNLTVGPDTGEGVIAYVQPSWDDATHIAAFAPRTVLALIAWLKKAEATIARVEALAAHWQETGNGHYRDLDKALGGEPT